MIKTITSKKQVIELIQDLKTNIELKKLNVFIEVLNSGLLKHKAKFPIIEHCAIEAYSVLDPKDIIKLCDKLIQLNALGSYVFVGMLLQKRLNLYFEESIYKMQEYIIKGNEWYTCDILSERVLGNAMLMDLNKVIPLLHNSFMNHPNDWIKRSVGVAVHLAAKRGLTNEQANKLMQVLMLQVKTKNFHVKKGCGWGIETIARFNLEVATKYEMEILEIDTNSWVKMKYKLGVSKAKKT